KNYRGGKNKMISYNNINNCLCPSPKRDILYNYYWFDETDETFFANFFFILFHATIPYFDIYGMKILSGSDKILKKLEVVKNERT
ncbi:MAG: hypothetical protein ACP5TO_08015, partial [Thermoplasmata archaeon]